MASSVQILSSEPALLPERISTGKAVGLLSDPVQLARAINGGSLLAEDLEFHRPPGVRFLRAPARATLEELRGEVHCLRSGVADAVARGELRDPELTTQVEAVLARVDRELTRSCPNCDAVVPNLKRASELLLGHFSTRTLTASRTGPMRLAPIAATAWAASVRIFKT